MTENLKNVLGVIVVALIVFVLGMLAGSAITVYTQHRAAQREAVKQGVAEWVPDEDGRPEFRWISPDD